VILVANRLHVAALGIGTVARPTFQSVAEAVEAVSPLVLQRLEVHLHVEGVVEPQLCGVLGACFEDAELVMSLRSESGDPCEVASPGKRPGSLCQVMQ
jgi:hypothetical protein